MTDNTEVLAEAMRLADKHAVAIREKALGFGSLFDINATQAALESFLREHLAGQAENAAPVWIALENCRLFAARHRKEEWAQSILRLCAEGGATSSPLRAAQPSAAPALNGRSAIVEAWNDLPEPLRCHPGLKALYRAAKECEDAKSAAPVASEREALNYLGLIARGPQHPGYISGIPDRIWASFGQEVCDEAQRIVASLPPAAPAQPPQQGALTDEQIDALASAILQTDHRSRGGLKAREFGRAVLASASQQAAQPNKEQS